MMSCIRSIFSLAVSYACAATDPSALICSASSISVASPTSKTFATSFFRCARKMDTCMASDPSTRTPSSVASA